LELFMKFAECSGLQARDGKEQNHNSHVSKSGKKYKTNICANLHG
jgi:hypothetical protein